MSSQLDALANQLERIALLIADKRPHRTPEFDAKFLLLAADALRSLGGQVTEIAKIGHKLKGLSSTSSEQQP